MLFASSQVWLALALISALGGAALMLAQRDLKRMLAFSTIEDMGYLVLGVVAGGELGMTGAALGLSVHALAKALLFGSLAAAEADGGPVTLGVRGGLASRYPWSAVGFLAGSLAMLGIPPLAGFAARWQLYEAATGLGYVFLGALVLATGMSVLSYARAVTLCWWGPCESSGKRGEPALLVAALVGICVVLLVVGLCPAIFVK
jgi:multicomponent Na+:H+ antiporter subunit D